MPAPTAISGSRSWCSAVPTLSWWRDIAAIKAFAGEDYEKSRYYAEDAKYLLEWNEEVEHFEVVVDRRRA
jgi:hypothetical protein